ncbi:strawberry notch C-terminal domain-containing protein [Thiocystis violacea]|uniref:strawberry notch C-terminal domain-containing protein n=1 Tax=Thiocystis violacea TaxID=13725 RepID=UPI001905822B|nr:strawberry notch C-terminal domain-containing protein [Thiocystis violacea]MBK1718143.1 hypothetical protein [Thiocystis violacea]
MKWLGPDFEGVIAFDEAHSMGNALDIKGTRGVRKASLQALAGVNLQRELPKARVVYVSATGATEVSNLSYGERLGLWGEGTAFADKSAFVGQIATSGVAGMEVVARDLKALGLYTARSLSYDDVTYERLEYPLSDFDKEIYNELARAWQIVLDNVDAALKLTGAGHNGNAASAALSQFWGAHQRFFNQVITSLQTPAAIDHMRRQLDDGGAIVVQLVNTNEAAQERILAAAAADGIDLEELDFTPRQALMDYVRNGFPIQAFEESKDADGNTIWTPVTDSDGNPVFDQRAIDMRDALLETLAQIRVPENPLDAIINAFGSDRVAEITGRSRRFVQTRDDDGNIRVQEEKRGKNAARVDAELFQSDKKDVLVFSGAGGTGYSFHADNTAANKRRRYHYILQPGWRADGAVQGFGRTHRTNQASAPHYVLPTTDLQAQKRFVSSIARRLDQLGALTRGQREATSQGLFSAADNLESQYARDSLLILFRDLHAQRTPLSFADVCKQMGLKLLDKDGTLIEGKIPDVPQFLNRLLSLTTDMQDAVFDQFEARLVEAVEYAKQQGLYDEGLKTLRAASIVKTADEVVYTHSTGAETRYVELAVTNPVEYLQWEDMQSIIHERARRSGRDLQLRDGWFVSEYGRTKGQVFHLLDNGARLNSQGQEVHRGVLYGIRKDAHRYVDNVGEIADGFGYRRIGGSMQRVSIARAIAPVEARVLWESEVASAPKTETVTEGILVGVILPIWDRVVGSESIYRLQTDGGEQLLGRRMGPKSAAQTKKNLGIDSDLSNLSASELLTAIRGGKKAVLANGWEILPVTVAYEQRLEIRRSSPFSFAELALLQEQGAFVERVNWSQRAFLPSSEEGLAVFERITASKPVVDLFPLRGRDRDGGQDSDNEGDDLAYGVPEPRPPATLETAPAPNLTSQAPAGTPVIPPVTPSSVTRDRAMADADAKRPYHEIVAERLIEQLKQGTAPWQRPWNPGSPASGMPFNPTTGKRYRGINAIWLMSQGFDDARWMTLNQANSVGAQIRKGEKSTSVQFWQFDEERAKTDEEGKVVRDENGDPLKERIRLERPIRRFFRVFNAEQIDGLSQAERPEQAWDPIERAETILTASGADIIHSDSSRAFYRPATDTIHLPHQGQFPSADRYYATALHELGHWTGHASRLGRDIENPFGSRAYAKEELRAEIASLLLGEELAIAHDPGQHAAYVASWIEALEEDPMEIFRAAADAEKIVDFVRGFEQERQQTRQSELTDPIPVDLRPQSVETLGGVDVLIWSMNQDMQRADDAFQSELERVYGKKEAGEARYRDAHDDLQVQAARDAVRIASEVWHGAVADHRAYLTMRDLVERGQTTPDDRHLQMPAHWWRHHLAAAQTNYDDLLQQTYRERAEEERGRDRHDDPDTQFAANLVTFARAGLALAHGRAEHPPKIGEITTPEAPPKAAPPHPEDRIYIDVAYREKDAAKALGAKWDRGQRSWYIPSGVDAEPFARWSRTVPMPSPGPAIAQPPRHSAPAGADRLYLAVPYAQRGDAKAAGCRWDTAARSWYADPERLTQAQLDAIDRWRPERVVGEQAPPMDPRQEFKEALLAAGCVLQDPHPIMDGSKQRVPVHGDTGGARGGYYRAYLDGHPAGTIKNYRTGDEIKWVATGYRLSDTERAKLQADAANTLAERAAQRARTFAATAARVARQFAKLTPLSAPTPYLAAKGLALDPGVRTDDRGTLFVPASDVDGRHWTTQSIQADGQKRFAKDSRKEGCFYVTGGRGVEALADAPRIVIAEGFATAQTLADALGHPVVTAFSADNLTSVAEALHARFHAKPIVIAGDDDRHLILQEGRNRGREAAQEAAAAVGGTALFPVFAPAQYRHPQGLKAITPATYRAHCQAKTTLDRARDGETALTEARRAQLTETLLSEPQLAWLDQLKQHSDFNDLARHSRFGPEGVVRQLRALEERLARNGHPARTPLDRLNTAPPARARRPLQDATSGAGERDEPPQRRKVRVA